MTVHLVTFSDESMSRSARLCIESALKYGVTDAYPWTLAQLFESGTCRVSDTFEQVIALMIYPKGLGYWSWKPLIITESLNLCSDGDILIYSDAGIEFINNVSYIIERMDQDIFLFGNNWEHAHWCKRDVVEAVYGESWLHQQIKESFAEDFNEKLVWSRFGKQVQASVIFFRVSDYTRTFVAEWLKWCLFEGGRLIDDSPSRLPNHPEFREHRHDQAILTTMAYREGLRLHWWGARYNMDQPGGGFVYDRLPEYAADDYEPFVWHHRRRNHEWKA